jgi:8-oxo-dGTP pyrophosphatase MutT (NUDIX family)
MTAIRETFEETGLLLASATSKPLPSDAVLDASRESIHTGRTLFRNFLKQHALSVDLNTLLPFTEWITPLRNPRCARLFPVLSKHLYHTS